MESIIEISIAITVGVILILAGIFDWKVILSIGMIRNKWVLDKLGYNVYRALFIITGFLWLLAIVGMWIFQ